MIVSEAEAYTYARQNAHALERIEALSDGTYRVVTETSPNLIAGVDYPQVVDYWVPQLPEQLEYINTVLLRKGWPDLSPWWRKQIARAYFAERRTIGYRVGRRGGKSTTICRVAVYEALFAEHNVPPGDVGVFGIVSAERPQAKDRINTIKAIFDALGVDCKALSETIQIKDRQREIRCYTASKEGVVGCTSIGWLLDEMTRWRDNDDGSNPAIEVVRSLMPTIATMPEAKVWWISSPFSTIDIHYELIERGNDDKQIVAIAPTWVANPTLTEEDTRHLERDTPTWEREYAAIPMAGDESKFFSAALLTEAKVPFKDRAA